ncbi:hypothetical protein DFJ73DRAFT_803818 [Zopfochytrium polystomum]|nr:hypothetical protein DFJ73DRAFT_803818 [Zopfochytrium polystomum]
MSVGHALAFDDATRFDSNPLAAGRGMEGGWNPFGHIGFLAASDHLTIIDQMRDSQKASAQFWARFPGPAQQPSDGVNDDDNGIDVGPALAPAQRVPPPHAKRPAPSHRHARPSPRPRRARRPSPAPWPPPSPPPPQTPYPTPPPRRATARTSVGAAAIAFAVASPPQLRRPPAIASRCGSDGRNPPNRARQAAQGRAVAPRLAPRFPAAAFDPHPLLLRTRSTCSTAGLGAQWWNVRVGWTDARNAALSLVVARIALRHFLVYEPTLPKADDPFYGATLVELAVVTDNLPLLVAIVQTRRAWARAAPAGRLQPHFDHLFSFAAGAGALTIVRATNTPTPLPPLLPLYPPFSAACECGRSETVRLRRRAASGDPDLIDLLHARVPTSTLSPAENNCEALIAASPPSCYPPRAENIVIDRPPRTADLPVLDVALKSIRTSPQTSRTAAPMLLKCAPLAHLQARVSGWLMYGFVEACWEIRFWPDAFAERSVAPEDEVRARVAYLS